MRKVRIRKRSGSWRLIYVPNPEERRELRSFLTVLNEKARKIVGDCVHGFLPGRSAVTGALAHVGKEWTLKIDIKDFFDHVRPEQVQKWLTKEQLKKVFVDGAARAGLPTSPAVANMAASALDQAILRWLDKQGKDLMGQGPDVVYTRYADDLVFSYDNPAWTAHLREYIPRLLSKLGFKAHPGKTSLQWAGAGLRVIYGIGVGPTGIHPLRRVRRRLRAALHQKNVLESQGLQEWCKLRLPRKRSQEGETLRDWEWVRKHWRLPKIDWDKVPQRKVQWLDKDVLLTGDPIYILGCSTLTTGWKSCLCHPSGRYSQAVLSYLYWRGCRVAVWLSDRWAPLGATRRRLLRARAFVYELRNGKMVYGTVYPVGTPIAAELGKILEKQGILSIDGAKQQGLRGKIVGHFPFDVVRYGSPDLIWVKCRATKGPWKGKRVWIAKL